MSDFTDQMRAALSATMPALLSLPTRQANLRRVIIAQEGWDYHELEKHPDEYEVDLECVNRWLADALESLSQQPAWDGELPALLVRVPAGDDFSLIAGVKLADILGLFQDPDCDIPLDAPLPLSDEVVLYRLDTSEPMQAKVALHKGALVPRGEWESVLDA